MSISALEVVKEFFIINDFYVTVKNGYLFVKNIKGEIKEIEEFIIEKEKIGFLDKGMVRVLAWHTLKFTPSVIEKFHSEIFEITTKKILKDLTQDKNYKKILIIPGLPSTVSLRNQSIKIMKENGIDYIILFPTVISSLIEKVDERNLYQSHTLEIIRILKFYKFFAEKKFEKLLFDEK